MGSLGVGCVVRPQLMKSCTYLQAYVHHLTRSHPASVVIVDANVRGNVKFTEPRES